MFQIFLIYIMHTCAWWCLATMGSVVRGDGCTMKHSSAAAIAVFSTVLHITIRALYFT